MASIEYRGYEIDNRSILGGFNISKDGEYVDHVIGDLSQTKHTVDQIIEEA